MVKQPFVIFIAALLLFTGCTDDSPPHILYKKGDYWIDNFRNNSLPSKAFADGRIYCSNIEISSGLPNLFYCLNLVTGKVDWAAKVDNWACVPPVIADTVIYYSSFVGDIYRFDKNGNQVWQTRLDGSFAGHCINPYNNNLFVKTVTGGVVEFDIKNGAVVNRYGGNTLGITQPVFWDNKMFLAGLNSDSAGMTTEDYLCCFDTKTRKKLWEKYVGKYVRNIFMDKGRLYYPEAGNRLSCVDAVNGNRLWQSDTINGNRMLAALPYPQLAFTDSTILYYGLAVAELDKADGHTIRKIQQDENTPYLLAVAKQTVFSIDKAGKQYTVTVLEKLLSPDGDSKAFDVVVKKSSNR
jgi:outer membrane protein assembly factor BamB